MTVDIEQIRGWAESILWRMNGDERRWVVEEVSEDAPKSGVKLSAKYQRDFESQSVAVRISEVNYPNNIMVASYPVNATALEAIAELASQIQDHLVESESGWGEPLPCCNEHQHPLNTMVCNNSAMWVCPTNMVFHSEPIIGLE